MRLDTSINNPNTPKTPSVIITNGSGQHLTVPPAHNNNNPYASTPLPISPHVRFNVSTTQSSVPPTRVSLVTPVNGNSVQNQPHDLSKSAKKGKSNREGAPTVAAADPPEPEPGTMIHICHWHGDCYINTYPGLNGFPPTQQRRQ